jgi:hypothetical protein
MDRRVEPGDDGEVVAVGTREVVDGRHEAGHDELRGWRRRERPSRPRSLEPVRSTISTSSSGLTGGSWAGDLSFDVVRYLGRFSGQAGG